MRDGALFRRPQLEPLTAETGYSSLLPTPTASSYGRNKGGANPNGPARPSLATMAKRGLLMTLTDAPCGPAGSRGDRVLNPQFVEWMMGLPIGWTDFEL